MTLPKMTEAEREQLANRYLISRLVRLVAINAYASWHNTVVGNPAPRVAELYEKLSDPRPGDLVLETSTVWRWARSAYEAPLDEYPALGTLMRKVEEPVVDQEALDKMHASGDYWLREGETLADIPTETVWYIVPLADTQERRWTNASFIRVLTCLDDQR
jgi:hypothetical protein